MNFEPWRMDQVQDEEEWSKATRRYLQATYPADTGTAIFFVPGRTQKSDDEDVTSLKADSRTPSPPPLTGDEAREFYEGIVSLPRQSRKVNSSEILRRVPPDKDKGKMKSKEVLSKRKRSNKIKVKVNPFKLFQYAENNELDLLQSSLSDGGFDVDLQDNFHWTLLMTAAYAGHMTIVEYLMEVGARWQEYSDRGMNAADLARSRGHEDVAVFIESFDCCEEEEEEEEEEGAELEPVSEEGISKNILPEHRTEKNTSYCDSCQTVLPHGLGADHHTSIVHLYSDQRHVPRVIPYEISESNRGFQMMLRSGWNPDKGLGSQRQGQRFPVKTVLKQDRLGFGLRDRKARVTHFSAHDKEAVRSRKKEQPPAKKKTDFLKEKQREKQWERRIRTIMNHEDSHLFT